MRVTTSVAAGVLAVIAVACGGDADSANGGTDDGGTDTVAIEAGDLYFNPEALDVAAGTVTFTVTNVGATRHTLVIEEAGDVEVLGVGADETATGTATLEQGTYTFYCSVPGHRSSMEGTLTVS